MLDCYKNRAYILMKKVDLSIFYKVFATKNIQTHSFSTSTLLKQLLLYAQKQNLNFICPQRLNFSRLNEMNTCIDKTKIRTDHLRLQINNLFWPPFHKHIIQQTVCCLGFTENNLKQLLVTLNSFNCYLESDWIKTAILASIFFF